MEEIKEIDAGEGRSSSDSRPPKPLASSYRQRLNTERVTVPCKKSLVRHPSLHLIPTIEILLVVDHVKLEYEDKGVVHIV